MGRGCRKSKYPNPTQARTNIKATQVAVTAGGTGPLNKKRLRKLEARDRKIHRLKAHPTSPTKNGSRQAPNVHTAAAPPAQDRLSLTRTAAARLAIATAIVT